MKKGGELSLKTRVALALTWDGARWPIRLLPPDARAFLASSTTTPPRQKLAALFADDAVTEIRICWVPRLKGGDEALSEPIQTASGKRIGFRATKSTSFGDIMGVVYRR